MDDIPGFNELESRDLLLRVVTEGQRRVRRRRFAAVAGSIVVIGAGLGGAAGAGVFHTNHGQAVNVAGEPPLPAQCRAGGIPGPGQARVGESVRFGQLPAGFAPVPTPMGAPTPILGIGISEAATPGGQQPGPSTGELTVSLQLGANAIRNPNTTVAGHPAQESHQTSTTGLGETFIGWDPEPGVSIGVQGNNVPQSQVEAAAQSVVYHPGLAAARVGSMGPVIPRADILHAINYGKPLLSTERVITWLVGGREWGQAELDAGTVGADPSNPNNSLTQMMKKNDPYWVVAILDYTPGPTGTLPDMNGGHARANVQVFNAISGDMTQEDTYPDATIGPDVARLVDHSVDGPCPSPSTTEPTVQPPLVTAPPSPSPATVPARVTNHDIYGQPPTIMEIDVGSNQGVRRGDPVAVPGAGGGLVGQVINAAANTSLVDPITSTESSTSVRIDPAGHLGYAIGQGPGKPLKLEVINQAVPLSPGDPIVTSGPTATGYPEGISIGIIANLVPASTGMPEAATVQPTVNTSTVTGVEVILQPSH